MVATGDSLFWAADNEQLIKSYTVQQSTDGTNFSDLLTRSPGAGSYQYFAAFKTQTVCTKWFWKWCVQKKTSVVVTHYWYRVKALDSNGVASYSEIIKT